MRKPHWTCLKSGESSSASDNGFCGTSQAVTIVVLEGTRGPTSGTPLKVVGPGLCEQPAEQRRNTAAAAHAR